MIFTQKTESIILLFISVLFMFRAELTEIPNHEKENMKIKCETQLVCYSFSNWNATRAAWHFAQMQLLISRRFSSLAYKSNDLFSNLRSHSQSESTYQAFFVHFSTWMRMRNRCSGPLPHPWIRYFAFHFHFIYISKQSILSNRVQRADSRNDIAEETWYTTPNAIDRHRNRM